MFGKKKDITITIKLNAGLDKKANITRYDPNKGHQMTVQSGTRLKKALVSLGLDNLSSYAYFCNGKRIGLFTKLKDGNDITCIRPSAGG